MIRYSQSLEDLSARDLGGFFAGWPDPPSPGEHLAILKGSSLCVLARADAGRVIGFVTALSDGVQNAYLPLLEVLPPYRGQGIGSELVRQVLASLGPLYSIALHCDPSLEPFYRRFGMRELGGMVLRRPEGSSGLRPGGRRRPR